MQRILINTGLVQTAKEARHEGDEDVKSEEDVNVVSDLEDTEVRSGPPSDKTGPKSLSAVNEILIKPRPNG